MRLIDEKGRIFGRLNIIDLLAVVLILVVAVFLGTKLLGGRGGPENTDVNLSYTVKVYNVAEDVYKSIEKLTLPDQLMANGELLNGQIVSFSAEPSQSTFYQFSAPSEEEGAGNVELLSRAGQGYDLTFKIEAYVPNTVKREIGTQEVRVGKTHIVKTANLELVDGVIMACTWLESAS